MTTVVVGWALLSSLARPVVVEVVDVLAEHGLRVPLVVDQQVVGAFFPEAAACSRPAGSSHIEVADQDGSTVGASSPT
ncbi:hypothetical protein ABGB07_32115 [Micromonosporaceae bacterium B7E4]